jgi:hypothetical protein
VLCQPKITAGGKTGIGVLELMDTTVVVLMK